MFFEREMLNPNNEKYLLKTIDVSYIYYVIYGSTTTAIANLISLANIGPRVKLYFQLPSSLVLWSYRKKITYAMCYEWGGLRQQRTRSSLYFSALTGGSVL